MLRPRAGRAGVRRGREGLKAAAAAAAAAAARSTLHALRAAPPLVPPPSHPHRKVLNWTLTLEELSGASSASTLLKKGALSWFFARSPGPSGARRGVQGGGGG